MKKFILGVITGIILTFVFANIIAKRSDSKTQTLEGTTFFKEYKETTNYQEVLILQSLLDGYGLAFGSTEEIDISLSALLGPSFLYYEPGAESFYDYQIIDIGENEKLVQVGTYKYFTMDSTMRTVPMLQKVAK